MLERTDALAAVQHGALRMPTVEWVDGMMTRVDHPVGLLTAADLVGLGFVLGRFAPLVAHDITSALRRIHDAGLVHGNVSLDTIHLSEDGRRAYLSSPAPLLGSPFGTRWDQDLEAANDVICTLQSGTWWRRRAVR